MRPVKPTFLDRAIGYFAPTRGVRRAAARAALNTLEAAGYYPRGRRSRGALRNWAPGGGSADADIVPDLQDLRNDARALRRVTPVATAVIGRLESSVVGPGLRAKPTIDRTVLGLDDEEAEAWERETERRFKLWCESRECDLTEQQDFNGLQALVLVSMLESGDLFAVSRSIDGRRQSTSFAIQLFEADQVSTPGGAFTREAIAASGNRIVDGVELSGDGVPLGYHFRGAHPGELNRQGLASRWTLVPRKSEATGRVLVNHVFARKRIGQTRGVPILAPVIEPIRKLGIYSEAELYAAVISAMITVVIKNPSGGELPNVEPEDDVGASASDKDRKWAPGLVFTLDPEGGEIDVPDLGRPNSSFDKYFMAVVREIGAAIGMPAEVLLQAFTASYSASRAALEQSWQLVRMQRSWLVAHFCKWAYEEWLARAVAETQIDAPGFNLNPLVRQAWSGATWIGPGRISVDPLKENQADEIAEDRGWKTGEQITAEKTGGDYMTNVEARGREERARRDAGLPGGARSSAPSDDGPMPDRPENEEEQEN